MASGAESPGNIQSHVDHILSLYRAGRYAEALAAIEASGAGAPAKSGPGLLLTTLSGWCHLHLGAIDDAAAAFEAALRIDGAAIEPQVGMGYVLQRRGKPADAAARFRTALEREPRNVDALKGLGLALRDLGRHAEAEEQLRRALRVAPDDAEAQALLAQMAERPPIHAAIQTEHRPRPPLKPRAPARVRARARDGALEVAAAGGGFRPLFVKGVNFGVALPGRFPAEFPEGQATYASFLDSAAGMGANVVRTYTLLPPVFYAALLEHNRRDPARRLLLVQGVWTELPEDHDYDGLEFRGGFRSEIARVIDAVHGNLDLPHRPGHASGRYRADVSVDTLAWLLGREWEPFSVERYDALAARRAPAPSGAAPQPAPHGLYLRPAPGATPFERWLAGIMDEAARLEIDWYGEQRPIAFVSWPTLDPLSHPTEATAREETALRRRLGEAPGDEPILEYDNDGVSVDATHVLATEAFPAGTFAAYHAYPYYPDFISLDPRYGEARGSQGPSRYIGYLRDLRRHHGAQPIVIAEFGVPSSRGVAHLQPQGWHHGGHSEREQGEIDARLARDIHEAGLAGGIVFALVDEWFKRNWLVSDFEVPAERNPLWLNAMDPEQNYGLLAARPGARARMVIDGRGEDWDGIAPLAVTGDGGPERPMRDGHDPARTLRALRATSDEAYLYLRLDVERLDADGDGRPDWGDAAYLVGIDTYDPALGDRRLPIKDDGRPLREQEGDGGAAGPDARVPAGLEFCLVLDGEETSRLLVDPPYDVWTQRHHRPYGSRPNDDGRFIRMRVETNRRRIGRDGTVFPAQIHDRSPLIPGSLRPGDPDYNTRADWKSNTSGGFIEIRIAWGLLNVTDPSSRRVLHDDVHDLSRIGTAMTPGFRLVAAAVKPSGAPGAETPLAARLADRLPRGGATSAAGLPLYTWPTWEQPTYRIEKKEAWEILGRAFRALPSKPAVAP